MAERKKIFVNMLAAALSFSSGVLINFLLTPYLVEKLGAAAYGFVAIVNDFIAYLSVITMALNSMAGRFITIAFYQNKSQMAEEYYSSTLAANVVMGIVLFFITLPVIVFLEHFLQIPVDIAGDVKLLFLFSLINFLITMIFSVYGTGYIIRNQLYLSSVVQMKANALRLCVLLGLFGCFPAHISYMGMGALASTILNKIYDVYYQKKLVPELCFAYASLSWRRLREILSSGIWNTITRIGNILSGNLDLLLVNMFLSPVDMGVLAITKIVPNFLTAITGMMSGVYMPAYLEYYAKEDFSRLVAGIKEGMRIFSLVLSIPLVIFLSLGKEFFSLWVPSQDANTLYWLSVFSLLAIVIIGPVAMMHNVFTVVNRVKTNSLLVVLTGFLNTVGGYLFLCYTDWGVWGLVILTASLSLVRNLCYTVPFSARYIHQPAGIFFPVLVKACLTVILFSSVLRYLFASFIIKDYGTFAMASLVAAFVMVIAQLLFVFSAAERRQLLGLIRKKFRARFGR